MLGFGWNETGFEKKTGPSIATRDIFPHSHTKEGNKMFTMDNTDNSFFTRHFDNGGS